MSQIGSEKKHHKFLLRKHRFIFVFCMLITLTILYVLNIYSFLTVTKPIYGQIFIVEGWIPSYLLKQAIPLINQGSYETIAVVGGPSKGETAERIEQTAAYQCKNELVKLGIPDEKIKTVPVWHLKRNKTLTLAKAIDTWLKDSNPSVEAVDVFTAGLHGRKSHLLYQRALGKSIRVGIYSASPEELRDKKWFQSKKWTYLVLRNTVGYFNALIFTF